MAVVVSSTIFGGGPYSTTHSRHLRMVGKGLRNLSEIQIARKGRMLRDQRGIMRASIIEPFMPKHITEPYHPGGNSVCYTIQTAHLMGCDPIILLGFTLKSGTGYTFGRTNPATGKPSFYQTEQPLHWLRWYANQYPGRVKLYPGWDGPLNEVFETWPTEASSETKA